MLEQATKAGLFFFKYSPDLLYLWLPSTIYLILPRLKQKSVALSAYIQATFLGAAALTFMVIIATAGLAIFVFPIVYLLSLIPLAFVGAIYGFPLVLLLKELKFGARALCIILGPVPGLLLAATGSASGGMAVAAMVLGPLVMIAAITGIRYKQEQQQQLAQGEKTDE